jgi:hypothetical protein
MSMPILPFMHGIVSQGEGAVPPTGSTCCRPAYALYMEDNFHACCNDIDLSCYDFGGNTGEVTEAFWFRTIKTKEDSCRDISMGIFQNGANGVFAFSSEKQNLFYCTIYCLLINKTFPKPLNEEGKWYFIANTYSTGSTDINTYLYDESSLICSGNSKTNKVIPTYSIRRITLGTRVFLNCSTLMANSYGIWDRELTANDIGCLWNNGCGLSYCHVSGDSCLISWWDADQLTSSCIEDCHGSTYLKSYFDNCYSIEENNFTTYLPLSVPNGICIYPYTCDSVQINWNNNNNYADCYNVYCDDTKVCSVGCTGVCAFPTITSGTTACFKVSACSEFIPLECFSSECNYTHCSPPAPTNLTGTTTNNSIYLSWTNNHIYADCLTVYCNGSSLTTLPYDDTIYNVTGLSSGTTYEFKVGSCINLMTEQISDVYSGTTTTTTGQTGQRPNFAAFFDTTNRVVYGGVPAPSTNCVTFAGWFNMHSTGGGLEMVNRGQFGSGRLMCYNAQCKFCFIGNTCFVTSDPYCFNKWYFIAATDDSTAGQTCVYIYDETSLVCTYSENIGMGNKFCTCTCFVMGGRTGSVNSQCFCVNAWGEWNRQLSASEICCLWNNGCGLSYNNLSGFGLTSGLNDYFDYNCSTTSGCGISGIETGTINYCPI